MGRSNAAAEAESTAQSAVNEIGQAISDAAQQVSNFAGRLFGGD